MTTQAGLDAAYATEINDCSFNVDLGTRVRSRPQSFCDSVSIASTLDVDSSVTFSSTLDVASTATFAVPIVVMGQTFTPRALFGGVVLASGGLVPPTPGAGTFSNLTVSGTATIANAVMDAGSY
jgi:hypothetical protein